MSNSDSKTTAAAPPPKRDTESRCPKCGSRDFKVTYADLCFAANYVRAGKWVGTFSESAIPDRKAAYGDCAHCQHSWRFRNGWID